MSYEEYYDFEQILDGVDEEMLLMIMGIVGIIALAVLVIAVVGYIFQSIGLYTIAKRRGIANPWLAWLPVGNYWIAGSIADQYQYVVNGQVKNRRIILLVLAIVGMVVSGFTSSMTNSNVWMAVEDGSLEQLISVGGQAGLLNLVSSGLDIAVFVFWQIALYDLYTSCDPKHNVLFLVLGIIFGITVPYFIFACRKKELGMPPRQEREQPEPEPRTYKEPWEN